MVMSFSQMLHRVSTVAIAARLSSNSLAATAFTPAITNTIPLAVGRTSTRSFTHATAPLFSSPPTRYLLTYDYIPDVLEKRGPFREGHIGLAKEMIEEGTCVSGGPSGVPGEGVPNGGEFQAVSVWHVWTIIKTSLKLVLVLTCSFASFYIALFIFTSKDAAEKFVAEDPYVSGGIVTGHTIAEWTVVVGTN